MIPKPTVAEFFAGSGLVREGLGLWFDTVWANDICAKKAAVYAANFDDRELSIKPIEKVTGEEVPAADLAWASFPCQDLLFGRETRWNEAWVAVRTVLGVAAGSGRNVPATQAFGISY